MKKPTVVHQEIAIFDPSEAWKKFEKQSSRLRKFQRLETLVESGNLHKLQEKGGYILWIASRRDDVEMIDRCLKAGVDIDVSNGMALRSAIYSKSEQAVSFLIEKKADLSATSSRGETPILCALQTKQKDLAIRLAQLGAELNGIAEWGPKVALDYAISMKDRELVTILLRNGADISLINSFSARWLVRRSSLEWGRLQPSESHSCSILSHILVNDRKTAGRIKRAAEQGADFDHLAERYSLIGIHGLYVGVLRKGRLIRELEKAANALHPGGVSDPVKSKEGYYLLKVDKVDF